MSHTSGDLRLHCHNMIIQCFVTTSDVLTFCEKSPNIPWYSNPLNAEFIILAEAAATPAQKNVCHDRRRLQKVLRSSIAKRRPPIGALNAAATPPATPAVVNALLQCEGMGINKLVPSGVIQRFN